MKTKIKKKEAEMKKREGGGKGRMRESEGVDERKKSERMGEVSDAIIISSACTVQPEIASRFVPIRAAVISLHGARRIRPSARSRDRSPI
jgi:hypothetical protein